MSIAAPSAKSPPGPAFRHANGERVGGIQSIRRACRLLEEVAHSREGIGLADLSRRIGLHTSTTFHIAKTLVSLGYLRQIEPSRMYRIGRPLFTLAAAALDEVELVNLAGSLLAELSRTTGETSYFAVNSGDQLVVIAKHEGAGALRINDRIGNIRPKHCTALGKVMLAALSEEALESFLSERELVRHTPKTIVSPKRLREEIARIRKSGVAVDDGEFNEELHCIAVPVFDFTGRVIGSMGVSTPVWRLSPQSLQRQTSSAQRAAERLSAELGYRPKRV